MKTIQAFSGTMKHLKEGLDVVGDDLAEMLRRVSHPDGRKGVRTHGLRSELGIHGHRNETIVIELGRSIESDIIKVLHELGSSLLSCTIDGMPILRTRMPDYVELPESVRTGFIGKRLSRVVDVSETSIPELGDARIHEIFVNGDGTVSIYMHAPVTKYAIEAFLELAPKPQGADA